MSAAGGLEPLGAAAALVVVDMQRLFAEETEWQVASLPAIVPAVRRLIDARPEAALFTRFVTPPTADHANGRWRRYYRRWSTVTLDRMPAGMLDLMPEFAALARPGTVLDKTTFSSLADGPLAGLLKARGIDTLVLAGAETDVCVLATVLDAVDRGYRVVVAADAVTSGSLAAHAVVLDSVLPRFDQQVDVASVDQILAVWRDL
jgi:nicotinamidase-related amidase